MSIKKPGQLQFDLGNIRQPGTHESAPNANAMYTGLGGADTASIKPHTRQERYAIYQHYSKDKDRVDAGGAPSAALTSSYDSLRAEIPQQFEKTKKVATPDFDPNYMNDEAPYYPTGKSVRDDVAKGTLKVAPTTPDEATVAWDANTNNQFRHVHDVIAHAGAGVSFSGLGENIGGQAHMSTLPKEAHRAASAEIIGQNAYTEFTGNFVDQKGMYDVPDWAARPGGSAPKTPKIKAKNPYVQGTLL